MALKDPERFILHVCVVGFHHQRGCEVEFTFPPIGKSQDTKLPSEWRFLPFLALPDGAHNCEQDSSYFHLPALSTDNGSQSTVFGVSCFKQIDSKELKNKMDDVTRSTVQKSVCVLSYLPLYGYLKEKIQVATRVYFNEKDFARTEILEQLYRSLNMSVSPSLMEESLLFVGLSAIELLTTFRHRVLVLFKLLLLEKRVMFHGFPVGNLCTQLLSLVSLFPKMLQSGLAHAVPRESNVVTSENDVFHPSHTAESSEEMSVNIFGFPLAIFTKLQNGTVEIHDPELEEQLSLSTADLRFADYLIHHVNEYTEKGEQEAGWDGSEEWIRAQFKLYLLSLLSTIQHTDGEGMTNYNEQFVEAWRQTTNFQIWNGKEHAGIDDVHAGHPFQGQLGLSDIKIRLANVMQDVASKSERGRKIEQAVSQTRKAVGVAIDSARSFVASWLTELTQPHSEDLEEKEIEEEKEHKESIEDIQSIEKS
ncbi:Late secretory pathway protein AVL9-like protein [Acropora cervicornis]|uniref:Late secretory pathway protein AVL9-like protein n=1 Tax=Acropora cervicornis TaxID=6130 RepID=A0AAD9V8T4_ACRCE|nr:Late secretory pathway protein AVL9-like protein [Acropora cervicornis]